MKNEVVYQILFQIIFAVIWSALFAKFYPSLYNFVNKYTKAGENIQADLEFVNTIILRVPFLLIFSVTLPILMKNVK